MQEVLCLNACAMRFFERETESFIEGILMQPWVDSSRIASVGPLEWLVIASVAVAAGVALMRALQPVGGVKSSTS